uniref:Uncharacterized protein n=1 Tax=viral metagenome TaxID=1070528 RepID=A0A6M3IKA8_9ZZZZ
MHVIKCDRCERIVDGTPYFTLNVRSFAGYRYSAIEDDIYDLCLECRNSLVEWFKTPDTLKE